MISHRPIGELRGCARLSDSAAGKRDMRSIFLTVQAFLATRTSWEHRRRPTEDLAEKLLLHSLACRGHAGRPERRQDATKKVTFYDLRATGITWEALAKTEFLATVQRAGHGSPRQRSATSGSPKPLASMRASRSQGCRSA